MRADAGGALFEIGADQLALDADEARALAEQRRTPSEEALGLLFERTEGWLAGIALALHALREPVSAEDIAQAITGDQREIADHLVEGRHARPGAAGASALPASDIGPGANDGAAVRLHP